MHRTLFIGDVHGCAHELADMLAIVRPDRVFLTGDLFTRGPDPVGCWELVREHQARMVMGNHEDRMLRRWDEAVAGRGRSYAHEAVRALAGVPGLRAWIEALPLHLQEPGWLLVHAGVHPKKGLAGSSRDQLLNLRRWPDDARRSNPFWWKRFARAQRDNAPPLVIYGHDAVRQLQDRRPTSLGLDGGCVFGGALCGYLLEEDRLLQVPARRVWLRPES
jgi:diadenosine tetraphosphatase ApaH/serine/threonine PP2A family protein phosphatase